MLVAGFDKAGYILYYYCMYCTYMSEAIPIVNRLNYQSINKLYKWYVQRWYAWYLYTNFYGNNSNNLIPQVLVTVAS